jgi:protein required for attachment to host cells
MVICRAQQQAVRDGEALVLYTNADTTVFTTTPTTPTPAIATSTWKASHYIRLRKKVFDLFHEGIIQSL